MSRPRLPRVQLVCEQCDKQFSLAPSQIKQGRGKFCSRDCQDIGRRRTVLLTCEQCGKEFSLCPSQIERQAGRFCSRQCLAASMQGQLFPNPNHPTLPIGSRRMRLDGYVEIKVGPSQGYNGWALEHRVVAEEKYGRPIEPGEHVHHLNSIRSDNDPSNLEIVDAGTHGAISNQQGAQQRKQLRQENTALRAMVERYQHLYGSLPPVLEVQERPHICEHCGAAYQPAKPSDVRDSRYCSNDCRLAAMHVKAKAYHASRRPAPITCQYEPCSKVFQVPWNRLAQAKYCSRACQSAAQRLPVAEKTCEVCQAPYTPRLDGAAKSRFCSIACRRVGLAVDWRGRANPRRGFEPPAAQMCAYCAQSYRPRFRAEAEASRYCSRVCWRQAVKRKVTLRLVSTEEELHA